MSLSSPPRPSEDRAPSVAASNGGGTPGPVRVRRRIAKAGPYLFVGLLIAAAIAGYFLVLDRDDSAQPVASQEVDTGTAPITRRDLQVRDSLDGTLTFASASTVKSSVAGAITSLPIVGETREAGDVLYTVDGEPVLLLDGQISMWRALGIGLETTPVVNQLAGTITAIAADGSTANSGDVLYRVNTEPVIALNGSFPAFRTLSNGVEAGRDVRQLEQNLVALGYDPDGTITVDRSFTEATEAAVLLLQADLGAEEDGIVDLGEIVFMVTPQRVSHVEAQSVNGQSTVQMGIGSAAVPGATVLAIASPSDVPTDGPDVLALEENLVALGFDPGEAITVDMTFDDRTEAAVKRLQEANGAVVDGVFEVGDAVFLSGSQRISEQLVAPGDVLPAGVPVLEVTSSEQVVTVELEATRQGLVSAGDSVGVELPDGTEVEGRVTELGAVARIPQSAAGADAAAPVIDVTISLPPGSSGGLDQSPVDILVATDSVEQALTVPVSSLLAVAGGGYALEVVDVDSTRLVGVELGLFSDGLVEITGSGVREGDNVVVPR